MTLQDKNIPRSSSALWRVLLFVVALPISVWISTSIWVESRTLFQKLSFKTADETAALEKAVEMTTTMPTELKVVSDMGWKTEELKAGTTVKVLGTYMEGLGRRIDGYTKIAPDIYKPSQYFYIELADGTRGAAQLPEIMKGRRIVVGSGDTLTVSAVKKNDSGTKHPYTYSVEGSKESYEWGDFKCVDEDGETMVYSFPLPGVTPKQLKKQLNIPRFLSIPAHEQRGFFIFPRYEKWNMYRLKPWLRSRLMVIVVWIALMITMLSIVGKRSNKAARDARNYILDTTLDNGTATTLARKHFATHYYPWAFAAGCLFTPLVWIWTKMNYGIFVDNLKKDLLVRCPKCHRLALKYEASGKETEKRFVGRYTDRPDSYTEVTGKVWDKSMNDGKGDYRYNTRTTHFNKESWDEYEFEIEMVLYCNECDFRQSEWIRKTAAKNRTGGDVSSIEETKWV